MAWLAARMDRATDPVQDWIMALDGPERLDQFPSRVAGAAGTMSAAGLDAVAVARELTGLQDALTGRLLALAEMELGAPPVPYAWLALGSAGRAEQSLVTDQDHAIAYAADTATTREYFPALAGRLCGWLETAGLARCPGGYMADRWQLPVVGWRDVFRSWVDNPEPSAIVCAEVFLDLRAAHVRPVPGALDVGVLDAALRGGSGSGRFLTAMARAAVRFPPPRGWLGRAPRDRRELDLKRSGLAAIVLLARLFALAAGAPARHTARRLAEAAIGGTVSEPGAAALDRAYRLLTETRLAAQLRLVERGRPATNVVLLGDLNGERRRDLWAALHDVQQMLDATAMRFRTDLVM
jgi:CBS domain-containing protein